jgi:hypothetical protein
METPKCHTSFKHNANFAWASKLMMEELPLLSTLQIRRPDLYNEDWNCVLCDTDKETWSHLWTCPVNAPKIRGLCSAAKQSLIDLLASHDQAPSDGLTDAILRDLDALDCWNDSLSTDSALNFDLFIRGFIPTSLVTVVQAVVKTRQNLDNIIALLLFTTQQIFKKEI